MKEQGRSPKWDFRSICSYKLPFYEGYKRSSSEMGKLACNCSCVVASFLRDRSGGELRNFEACNWSPASSNHSSLTFER